MSSEPWTRNWNNTKVNPEELCYRLKHTRDVCPELQGRLRGLLFPMPLPRWPYMLHGSLHSWLKFTSLRTTPLVNCPVQGVWRDYFHLSMLPLSYMSYNQAKLSPDPSIIYEHCASSGKKLRCNEELLVTLENHSQASTLFKWGRNLGFGVLFLLFLCPCVIPRFPKFPKLF